MSEIIPFVRTGTPLVVNQPMTDGERRSLEVALGRMARSYPYPLGRLFEALASIVRDYNLEDVAYKDLHPKGYVISANYPNFGLRWVFRMHNDLHTARGTSFTIDELRLFLNSQSKRYATSEFAGRFAYRFLDMLGDNIRIDRMEEQGCSVSITGQIKNEQFQFSSMPNYHSFQMTLERH